MIISYFFQGFENTSDTNYQRKFNIRQKSGLGLPGGIYDTNKKTSNEFLNYLSRRNEDSPKKGEEVCTQQTTV